MKIKRILLVLLVCAISSSVFAGTTGKISGRVIDAATKEPIFGANILVLATTIGGSSDENGHYSILKVPPGVYDIRVSCIGYQSVITRQVSVGVDRTTTVDVALSAAAVDMEAVVIVAVREAIVRDLTSTVENIGAQDIANLPVQNVGDILQLQAGVTTDAAGNIHMRGGRESEVQYYVDGMPVSNPFNGDNAFGNIQNDNVQELQVISGTFNAEYGRALSGIINIITKDGGEQTAFNVTAGGGGFASPRHEVFPHLDKFDLLNQKYLEASLGGPLDLLGEKLNYRVSGRFRKDENWLYGRRIYLPSDTANFNNPPNWIVQRSGDSSFVPMNPSETISGMAKISYRPLNELSVIYSLMVDQSKNKNYSHAYRYTPDYTRNLFSLSFNHLVVLTHTLSQSTFHELKFSYETYKREEHVRDNPYDSLYDVGIHPLAQSSLENVFVVGGVDPRFLDRLSATAALKYEITSQVDRYNMIKAGAEGRLLDIREETFSVVKNEQSGWQLTIPDIRSSSHNFFHKYPIEGAFYIQDKIEVEDLIVNAGVRFDYFDPRSRVPRFMIDPHNDDTLSHALYDESTAYREATPKMQVSPRLGLAFPISEDGNIHASYGHFFQMPEYDRMYENPEFEVTGRYQSFLGNADLDAQRTVTYEIGLQQRIASNLVLDVTCFYKDIRNLAGTTLYQTFDLDQYGQYSNKDYGVAWGITVSLDILKTGLFSSNIDYTYQIAEGNGSDPRQAFLDAQNRDESTKSLVPLNWDQRNVLNAMFAVEGESWGLKSISHYATGTPYNPVTTFDQQRNIQLMNQGRRRAEFNMDVTFYQRLPFFWVTPTLIVSVYNVFDAERIDLRPELSSTDLASHETRAVLNSLYEYRFNPGSQPRPRLVRVVIEIGL
ncbi:MAG: hypothetical protein A2X67_14795 [Ignavibacteria bacterium GWA2_55_11]|nr:MAG: hypothetical protein A2X67_14795 [Ignavibacteria bacterium GWA2_55_11]OGU76946.1 MAG: hypothetical protein A3G43_13315 [Ignavibacteria bacterium RIFCSPLOWO2_12_FULL_56_21]